MNEAGTRFRALLLVD